MPCPPYGEKPEGCLPLQLPIPPVVSQDPTKSPEAKRIRKSFKLNRPCPATPIHNIEEDDETIVESAS